MGFFVGPDARHRGTQYARCARVIVASDAAVQMRQGIELRDHRLTLVRQTHPASRSQTRRAVAHDEPSTSLLGNSRDAGRRSRSRPTPELGVDGQTVLALPIAAARDSRVHPLGTERAQSTVFAASSGGAPRYNNSWPSTSEPLAEALLDRKFPFIFVPSADMFCFT